MFVHTWIALLFGLLFVEAAPSPTPAAFDPSSLFNLDLVTQINVNVTLDSLVTNLVSINFDVNNPLIVPLVIQHIKSSASLNDTTFATFDHTFSPPFVINPFTTANSGTISNVLLTQGATNTLDIIPLGILDIDSDILVIELIPIPINGLKQSSVPTVYTLELD